jgi:N-acetylglucosamine kinase-like BadF-type ATPase
MQASDGHEDLVLGGDIGGTSTRILVVDRRGEVHGRGAAAGGNPTTHPDSAAAALAKALGEATAGVDPAAVRSAVIGLAGGGALMTPHVRHRLTRVWTESGVAAHPAYVSDLEVAFASGTAEPDGTVLIAGTGAAAGSLRDHRVTRRAGGHGWLLGDEGSGFWLGREAVRATLRALDLDLPLGAMAESVLSALGVSTPTAATGEEPSGMRRDRLVQAVNSRPPIELSRLAPLVSTSSRCDPEAAAVADRAAELLVLMLEQVRGDEEASPLVLAGSVASAGSAVGARLHGLVRDRFCGQVFAAQDGVRGAAWLALSAADRAGTTEAARERLFRA